MFDWNGDGKKEVLQMVAFVSNEYLAHLKKDVLEQELEEDVSTWGVQTLN